MDAVAAPRRGAVLLRAAPGSPTEAEADGVVEGTGTGGTGVCLVRVAVSGPVGGCAVKAARTATTAKISSWRRSA
jgi:hypothetical protein